MKRAADQLGAGAVEEYRELGWHIHDRGEQDKSWREMYWLDIDGVIFKLKTRILRVIEHKPRRGGLSSSQKTVLPLLAKGMQLLAATGLLADQSGVFVVYSDHPHEQLRVEQQKGWESRAIWPVVDLVDQQMEDFLKGEPVDIKPVGRHRAQDDPQPRPAGRHRTEPEWPEVAPLGRGMSAPEYPGAA